MKKLIAVFIILFVMQLLAGLALYIHSEVEYVKVYIPDTDNITAYNDTIAFTVYGKDNFVMYKKYYVRQEKLRGDYDISQIMPMVEILINERYKTVKEQGIERWKKITLNYQGIEPFSLEAAAYLHYTDMLISKSRLTGFKKELLRWYTIDKLNNQYSRVGLTKLFLDSSKFAENIYGIAAASKYYFNKDIRDINQLQQAFLLSAISFSNKPYDAVKDYQELDRKARSILNKLNQQNIISDSKLSEYMEMSVKLEPENIKTAEPAYLNGVFKQIADIKEIKENIGRKNIEIYTGYNEKANIAARSALSEYFKDKDDKLQAAFVLLNNYTQEIMAAIGSRELNTKVNRALTTSRQMASTFKPIVFLAAFEKGIKPSDQIIDIPYDFRVGDVVYRPNNYNGYFMGKIPVRYAFTYSLNNSTVKLAERVGLNYICELSKSMGMNKEIKPFYSMALGAFPATPLTVAQIYSTIGNMGEYKKAVLATGYKVGSKYVDLRPKGERVVSAEAAYQTLYIMQAVASRGTARGANLLKGTGAKTGTSNDTKDAWTATVFGDYTAVIWIGYDDLSPITYAGSGGRLAAPVISSFQRKYFGADTAFSFQKPANIIFKRVDARTGYLTNKKKAGSYIEAYNKNKLPKYE
ncbi:MAG: transglycosylase domain-containing protein [Mucispirillum sp.]|nr:transglycosylase domain-containing protein [Mucispirillum sp.]